MDKLSLSFLSTFSLVSIIGLHLVSPLSVHAATTNYDANQKSKCVTADTKALNANTIAKMEKDIAPYKTNLKATAAIAAYRESLAVSWEAMEQPYCGYGSPGASSARKSYVKTAERARNAFLTQVKALSKSTAATTTLAVPVTTTQPVMKAVSPTSTPVATAPKVTATTTTSVKPAPAPVKVAKPVAVRVTIPQGLQRGMRAASIADLQRLLFTHFDQDASSITTYFGPKTQDLLIRFQLEKNIISARTSPGAGQVGPRTAAALNSL